MSATGKPARGDDPNDVFAEFFGGGERHVDTGERYLVELESLVVAIFKRCEGLSARRQVIEVHEGGREKPVKKLGPYAEGSFTLLEGEGDGDIFRWYERGREADHMASSRRSGSVILVDRRGLEVARWKFRHAVVSGWDGPTETPDPAQPFAIERLEVTHEGLEMVLHDR